MRNFCVGGVLLDKQTPPLKGGSKDPRDYLQYGLSLSEQGQDQEAEENLRLAMDMDPQNGVFPMFLGILRLDLDQVESALEALNQAIDLDNNNLISKSYVYLAKWRLNGDEDSLNDILENTMVQSTAFEARLLMEVEKKALGKLPFDYMYMADDVSGGFLAFIDKPLKALRIRRANSQIKKSETLVRRERYEPALDALEKAVCLKGKDEDLSIRLKKVRKQRIKALLKGPMDPEAHSFLGSYYYENTDYANAEKHLRLWLDEYNKTKKKRKDGWKKPYALRMLADIEIQAGHLKNADSLLIELLDLDPHDPFNYYLLGKLRFMEKRPKPAIQAFESLLDKAPDFTRMRLRALKEKRIF